MMASALRFCNLLRAPAGRNPIVGAGRRARFATTLRPGNAGRTCERDARPADFRPERSRSLHNWCKDSWGAWGCGRALQMATLKARRFCSHVPLAEPTADRHIRPSMAAGTRLCTRSRNTPFQCQEGTASGA